jgi:GMP synthase (glutamine-hydrolysing)
MNLPKRLLLIDAVDWSPAYPKQHRLRNVGEWFARHLREDPSVELKVIHATDDVLPAARDEAVHGVIISGSPRDAWVKDPVNDRLGELILDCRERQVPFLGVCYGHQLLGQVLGAKVGRDPAGVELGNVELQLTGAGKNCPLFEGIPERFEALQSHQDSVLTLPPGAELLAQGDHTLIQSFRHGEFLMGVQFHPEQDPDIMRFVWEPRRATWRDKCKFDIDERLKSLRPAPLAAKVLKNFASLCARVAS